MTSSSLNARASAPTQHALSIMRPLLRQIALWQRERHGTAKDVNENSCDFDDTEIEETKRETASARVDALAVPVKERADAFFKAKTAASRMSQAEIAEWLQAREDPWAAEADTFDNGQLYRPHIRFLTSAARFAALLNSPEDIERINRRRSCTHLIVPIADQISTVATAMDFVLEWLEDQEEPVGSTWRNFHITTDHTPSAKSRLSSRELQKDYSESMAAAVREGRKIIAVTAFGGSLPGVARAVCEQALVLPPLSRELCIEILRVTHTKTGQLAEEFILDLLPEDPDLTGLPLEVVEGAFQEGTTVRVAKALACAANRLRMLPGATTLDDIVLNESVATPVNQLVDDIRDWQAGRLTWKDVSSSILLYGPPGNGKTLLATALAGSIGGPLVATSYSDCQQHGHQGDMLKALSRKVEEAVRLAPSVFFLDELDSFTPRDKPGRSSDYIVGVVNGLLELILPH
ncbi:ATP-binding protein [uncultured Tateyamaria sp.]|uniref:AAA family ATPase n=1 Tax=uncultured Tateyamaria sp. TaxID=455651 RepID=UPI002603F47D|nr:ATP-binding protein [uncultured Tateyamaria sp.]